MDVSERAIQKNGKGLGRAIQNNVWAAIQNNVCGTVGGLYKIMYGVGLYKIMYREGYTK